MEQFTYITSTTENIVVDNKGITIPDDIAMTVKLRGKRAKNIRFDNMAKEIQIKCSRCNDWHTVFKLTDSGEWCSVETTYQRSYNKENQQFYYGAYCIRCNANRRESKETCSSTIKSAKNNKGRVNWTIQHTIALTSENNKFIWDMQYLKHSKKNQIINQIIDEYRMQHKGYQKE